MVLPIRFNEANFTFEGKNIPVAAILTQTGGVTSHAAIVAREMEIPTVVGINNLLSRISPGDNLAVDAYEGTVTILEKQEATESAATPPLPSTQDLLNHDIEDLGSKAYVQAWLAHETAVNIPQAFLFPNMPSRPPSESATLPLYQRLSAG